MYKAFGIPSLTLREHLPNVFKDPDSFVEAWKLAFLVESPPTTLIHAEVALRNAVKKCRNWDDLKNEIQQEKKKTPKQLTIQLQAIADIENKLQLLYTDKMYSYDLPEEIVIDFSRLDETVATFYQEYLLRQLFHEITEGKREGSMLFIDEGSAVSRTKGTILPLIAERIRATGSLLVGVQSFSTLSKEVRGNCASAFIFKQMAKEDLDAIKAVNPLFDFTRLVLKDHEFFDLGQKDSHKQVYHFILNKPQIDFKPVVEWKPEVLVEENQTTR